MTASGEVFGISGISLWEIGKKHQQDKLPLPSGLTEWFTQALGNNVEILPLLPEIIVDAMNLPGFPITILPTRLLLPRPAFITSLY
jgi:PIN domain nuclease of toxin-antitoxin system